MKKLLQVFLLLLISSSLYAGGGPGPTTAPPACAQAGAFCTGTSYTFQNSTNVADLGGGGIYDCLGETPNAAWYHMQIGNSGTLEIDISQVSNNGTPIDVDFCLWGPFTSLASGCSSLSENNVVDCSFLPDTEESATITNAQAGQVYILLLTNYDNIAGTISFGQSNAGQPGAATTNCDILCNMQTLTATPGTCNPATGQYTVTGQITFQYPPPSGTLTISSSCGTSINIASPWVSPLSYSMPGLTANGAACTLTATFSADAACTLTKPFTAPAACSACSLTAGNSGPVCTGGTVNLTATTVTGASGYAWTGPNGFTSTVQNPTGITLPTTAGSYVYTVTATYNGQTCSSSTTVVVNAASVNAGADVAVCAGQPVTLAATGATTYSWTGGVTQGTAFTPTATTTYTVTGTMGTCTSTDQVVVTVNPLPVVNAGADALICEGATYTLSGSGATTYTWDNGVVDGVAFTPVPTASAATTYTVTGTAAGCTGTDQVTITITPTPLSVFTPSVTAGCAPLTVKFDNPNVVLVGMTYKWIFGNGLSSNFPGPVTTTYTGAGCYDVTLIATTANGCVGQTTQPALVCVSAQPDAAFTPNPQVLSQMDSYTNMSNQSTGADSYIWDFGDGSPRSTLTSPGHQFPSADPGTYEIMLIAVSAAGCTDTARVNIEVQEQLVYYVPNSFTPDNDEHNPVFKPVFTSGFDPFDYKLLIFNRWGEVVFESNDASIGWDGAYAGSPGLIQDGSYTWRIEFKTTRSDERKMLIGNVTLIR